MNIFSEFPIANNLQTGETLEAFCNGTGTLDGDTFQELLDIGLKPIMIEEFESAEIIAKIGDYITVITNYDANCGSDVVIPKNMKIQKVSYTRNANMNINACVNKLTELWGEEEEGRNVNAGETYEAYCNGTGTIYGYTFQTDLNDNIYSISELAEFETSDIVIKNSEGIINASVTAIEEGAFGNKGLTSVIIPNSVTGIGYRAFYNNQLPSVVIPNSITTISNNAFTNNNITCVNIPETTDYDSNSFDNKVIIHQGDGENCPIYIDDECFSGTLNNNEITIIDYSSSCSKNVVIPNKINGYNVTAISAATYNDKTGLYLGSFANKELTSVVIPEGIVSIGTGAFADNRLTTVTIPDSAASMGGSVLNAFYGNNFGTIIIPDAIGEYVFNDNNTDCNWNNGSPGTIITNKSENKSCNVVSEDNT